MLTDFGLVLLFILGAFVLFSTVMGIAWLVRSKKPTEEKLMTYESGEEPVGDARIRFNNRFYIIALIFVLFDVELVFLFPWAVVFGNEQFIVDTFGLWGWFTIIEMFLFVGVLALGLLYVWRRGFIDWIRPQQKRSSVEEKIPLEMYQRITEKYTTHIPKK